MRRHTGVHTSMLTRTHTRSAHTGRGTCVLACSSLPWEGLALQPEAPCDWEGTVPRHRPGAKRAVSRGERGGCSDLPALPAAPRWSQGTWRRSPLASRGRSRTWRTALNTGLWSPVHPGGGGVSPRRPCVRPQRPSPLLPVRGGSEHLKNVINKQMRQGVRAPIRWLSGGGDCVNHTWFYFDKIFSKI